VFATSRQTSASNPYTDTTEDCAPFAEWVEYPSYAEMVAHQLTAGHSRWVDRPGSVWQEASVPRIHALLFGTCGMRPTIGDSIEDYLDDVDVQSDFALSFPRRYVFCTCAAKESYLPDPGMPPAKGYLDCIGPSSQAEPVETTTSFNISSGNICSVKGRALKNSSSQTHVSIYRKGFVLSWRKRWAQVGTSVYVPHIGLFGGRGYSYEDPDMARARDLWDRHHSDVHRSGCRFVGVRAGSEDSDGGSYEEYDDETAADEWHSEQYSSDLDEGFGAFGDDHVPKAFGRMGLQS